ncbi:hypothetical protein GCM10017602_01630 [Herbiconiux flava]|nr:hypothetical protein GCM10017602_01630 [Herbiconiux flava]
MQMHHARRPTPSPVAFVLKWVAIAAAVALISVVSITAYAVTSVTQQFSSNAVDIGNPTAAPPAPPPFLGAYEGGFNLLVVGTDNDPNQGVSFGERDATLNDVNILLHVSADHQNAVVVSFPRDLVIPQPECTDPATGTVNEASDAEALNDAWGRGGLACTAATISGFTGVDIQYAAATSFDGVIELTNAVGGVEVCLTGDIADTDSGLYLSAGRTVIQGQDALAFLRNRKGVGDGSDLSRIGSQQQYLSSLLRKIKSESTLSDITKVYGLAQAAAQNIKPSTSLQSPDSMVSLALTLKDIDLAKVVFVSYPVAEYVNDINKVQPVPELADQLFTKILADQPFTLSPDSAPTGSADEGEAAPDPAPTDAAPPADAAPTDSAATPEVIEGLSGQNAAEETCAVPN